MSITLEESLQAKIRLINGTKTFALRKLKFDDDRESFQCLCCRVDEIHGVNNLLTHVNGKKHKTNLDRSHDPKFIVISNKAEDANPIAIQAQSTSSSSVNSQKPKEKAAAFNETDESRKIKIKIYEKYGEYKRIPTSHPKYNEEWEKFWSKRSDEVEAEGLDPDTYDYKPDWIIYWKDRLEELQEEETKIELSKSLETVKSLSLNLNSEISNVKPVKDSSINEQSQLEKSRKIKRLERQQLETNVAEHSKSSNPLSRVSSISTLDSNFSISSVSSSSLSSIAGTDYSPISSSGLSLISSNSSRFTASPSRNVMSNHSNRMLKSPIRSPCKSSISPLESTKPAKRMKIDEECIVVDSDEEVIEVSFTSVCRLLSAVEADIDSLGPKCLDLQSKAIIAKKTHPEKFNEILMTSENSLLLEQVKEKLQAKLELDLFDGKRKRGVKTTIKNIEKLLEKFQVPSTADEIKNNWKEIIRSGGETHVEILVEALKSEITGSQNSTQSKENEEEQNGSQAKDGSRGLSNDELLFLLENFDDLQVEEQNNLIEYLTKLEKTDPQKVKMLKENYNIT